MITLQDFYDQLNDHDWFYDWNPDESVWRFGMAQRVALKNYSFLSPEHNKLYVAFLQYKFGQPWKNHGATKPERP